MSFSRVIAVALAVVCGLSLLASLNAEYDILTRYDVTRPEGGRHFWLYSPTQYAHASNPDALPLILFFHGFSDTCELQGYISQFSIWAFVAELHQYHIAVMCGTGTPPGWASGMPRGNATVDDIAYTRASLAAIKRAVRVRPGHVFAMGHSNGAMMSELLACNASDIIDGIASNAGSTMIGPTINASIAYCTAAYAQNTTSILKIHGTADQAVIYNGTANFAGAIADTQAWGDRNGCKGAMRQMWHRGIAHSMGWTGCAGNTEVELVSLDGVNHQWIITSDFQSSTYVFDFFARVGHNKEQALKRQQSKPLDMLKKRTGRV